MKKFTAKCLTWSIILFIVGLSILLTAGLAGGFKQIKTGVANGFNKVEIFGFDIPVSFGWGNTVYDGTGTSFSQVLEGSEKVTKMQIDVGASQVILVSTTDSQIKVEGENVVGGMECEINGNECKIENNVSARKISIGGSSLSVITIYVPSSIKFEDIKIDLGAGDLKLSDINCDELELDFGAGDGNLSNVICDKLVVECGAGNLVFDGSISKEAKVDMAVGNAEMYLDDLDNYNIKVEAALGKVTIGDENYNSIGIDIERKGSTASADIEVEAAAGNVDIKQR